MSNLIRICVSVSLIKIFYCEISKLVKKFNFIVFMKILAEQFIKVISASLMFLIILNVFLFWLRMFIIAIGYNYKYKPVWILIILLFNIIGALVFYFAPYQ
jgi:hypothetical protein